MPSSFERRLSIQAENFISNIKKGETFICRECHVVTGKTKEGMPYGVDERSVARHCKRNFTVQPVPGCLIVPREQL